MVSHGLLVRLEAAPGKDADVEALLRTTVALLRDEPGTTAWYAVRFGRSEYGVVIAFHDEADRQIHLHGHVAMALMDSEQLFVGPPSTEKVRILAS
ncbi:MAG: putative quinol monooxygenase, partial [Lysobacter sp.]